ncbi:MULTISPECIES: hypothetical protein [Yersinia]|jgi:hypothetical protein|uniref:hypothetical protein n=1 Tax=Yersinia TaxID=629 RepID=UPI0005E14D55|nr:MULTISPECIES: hypothetical protein [Yersinia]EKN3342799.1 hypothetical protein [Yersinia enterocolitica]MCB5303820.1 hypothetical protein [Yersinia bercovieri]CFQ34287.1 Uncharacterised protein [Yersinia bercovieri]VDZ51372.1 Uncharacterised protein [Yersinia intermedia]HDL6991960.1 hypothetical protein [Yersinia enterocolitica]
MKSRSQHNETVHPERNVSVTAKETDKPLSMSKEQLIQVMVAAVPRVRKMPKAPKGEAAGKKAIIYG